MHSVCVVSILRLAALIYVPPIYYATWAGHPIAVWTGIEVNLALICSCLPPLRPLAARLWKKFEAQNRSFVSWGFGYLSSMSSRSKSSKSGDSEKSIPNTMTTTTTITITKESGADVEADAETGRGGGGAGIIGEGEGKGREKGPFEHDLAPQRRSDDVFTGVSGKVDVQSQITGGMTRKMSAASCFVGRD